MTIQENVSLKDKNWFRTGGNARYFCAPQNTQELQEAITWAQTNHVKIHVLGDGANTLISDAGFGGLVIHPAMKSCTVVKTDAEIIFVQADAGAQVSEVITFCLTNNALGLEELSGIPGTVGGSVYNNLHYFEFSFSDFLDQATVLDCATGQLMTVTKEWLGFGYDHSKLHDKQHVLVNATFKLKKATDLEAAYAKGRSAEIIRHRMKRYPTANTCGCFFRNFVPAELASTTGEKKLPYIAYYLDLLGIKGKLTHGGAQVSSQHANMIINTGNATSADIIAIARTMQEKVFTAYGLLPQPECELVGFDEYPFLKKA